METSIQPIFHMAHEASFLSGIEDDKVYFPPTYEADGFIHASSEASTLITVANHFYKSDPGKWICIKLEPTLLEGPVVFESPAPVGNKPSHVEPSADSPKFPHIYGGIGKRAVLEIYPMIRDHEGNFLSIEGL